MKFFNRQYLLQIGDYNTGDAISINDLNVSFSVRKSVNNKNKIDKAKIKITNLSEENIAKLESPYAVVVFSCGYESQDNVVRLFYGEVTSVETQNKGPDRETTIKVTPYFSSLSFQVMSALIPENGTVEDVIEAIRKEAKLNRGSYKGNNLKSKIIYGYSLCGTPREMLDQVCDSYGLQWKINGQALDINDSGSVDNDVKELAPVISPETGLIDRPYFYTGKDKKSTTNKTKKVGVKFLAFINPSVVPGSIVRVDFDGETDYYRVEEVEYHGEYRGNSWEMECICSKRPEGDSQ